MMTAISHNAINFSPADRGQGTSGRGCLRLASSNSGNEDGSSAPVHLTRRQLEVLALLCEGLPNKLICRRLDIAPGTAKAHISSILRELGVASRLQAVVAARRYGLLNHAFDKAEETDHNGGTGAIDFAHRKAPGHLGQSQT